MANLQICFVVLIIVHVRSPEVIGHNSSEIMDKLQHMEENYLRLQQELFTETQARKILEMEIIAERTARHEIEERINGLKMVCERSNIDIQERDASINQTFTRVEESIDLLNRSLIGKLLVES